MLKFQTCKTTRAHLQILVCTLLCNQHDNYTVLHKMVRQFLASYSILWLACPTNLVAMNIMGFVCCIHGPLEQPWWPNQAKQEIHRGSQVNHFKDFHFCLDHIGRKQVSTTYRSSCTTHFNFNCSLFEAQDHQQKEKHFRFCAKHSRLLWSACWQQKLCTNW